MKRRTHAEIARLKAEAAKGLTPEQLKRKKFCYACNTYKMKRQFGSGPTEDGRANICRKCSRAQAAKQDLKHRLLAKEIYVEGANQIVVDKMVGGRGLVSKSSLARFLGVHERTVIRIKNRGELTGYDFLGQTYFKKEEIEDWLEKKLGERIELDNKYIS